jgi:histone deacetylase complex regulatory component SIN3
MASQRESGRRAGNNLLKPLSEIDQHNFAPGDHVTPSYYKIPSDFPFPVCSGRQDEPATAALCDRYCSITTGSENFKFKQKYEYEDNLFKNEDAMYVVDHQILRLELVLNHLLKELDHA